MEENKQVQNLKSIFLAGVREVDPAVLIKNRVRIQGSLLSIETEETGAAGVLPEGVLRKDALCEDAVPEGVLRENGVREARTLDFNLDSFNRIIVTGAGKATAKMAQAVERLFKGRTISGTIAVKYGHIEPLECIQTIEAGHPIPDENSVLAARKIKEIAANADEKTLVINLISGGGSA